MNVFFDTIAAWLRSYGVPPVLGVFVLGALIAFIFVYRRKPEAGPEAGPAASAGAAAMAAAMARREAVRRMLHTASVEVKNGSVSLLFDGEPMHLPPEAIAHVRAGNKIEAIKALRSTSGLELDEAKQLVDMLAESPLLRDTRPG